MPILGRNVAVTDSADYYWEPGGANFQNLCYPEEGERHVAASGDRATLFGFYVRGGTGAVDLPLRFALYALPSEPTEFADLDGATRVYQGTLTITPAMRAAPGWYTTALDIDLSSVAGQHLLIGIGGVVQAGAGTVEYDYQWDADWINANFNGEGDEFPAVWTNHAWIGGGNAGYNAYFQITSDGGSSDTTPDAFTFTDQTGVATATVITSAPITVAGIDAAAAVSVSGGEWDKNNAGAWSSSAGTVVNGDTVRVRHTSSSSPSTATNTVLTIGGVSDTFTSTTAAGADTTPPVFSVAPSITAIASTTATVAGTSNESGTVSVIATTAGAAQPSDATFDAATSAITANTPFSVNRTGLTAAQLTRFWVQIRDAAGNRTTSSVVGLTGHAGYSRVIIDTPNVWAANRLTAVPDIASGDILEWGNIQGTGTVTVNDDGTFDADAGVTAFTVYVGNLTDGWGASAVQEIAEEDITAPQFTVGPAIANLLPTSWSVTGTANESGEVAIIVTSQAAAQPADSAFDASTQRDEIEAGVAFSVGHTGATADTPYRTWVQLIDQAGNRTTTSLTLQTPAVPDTTAPNFSVAISISGITQTTADFSATPNEGGIYGLVVLPEATAAPSISAVLAGSVSGAIWSRSQSSMSAGVQITATLTAMAAGQAYRVHAALQDASGNGRLVTSNPFTMLAAVDDIDPTISIGVVTAGLVHTFTATPADNVGVVGVQFFINGVPAGAELTSAPWQFSWSESGQPGGFYMITARARDAAGNTAYSNAIQLLVESDGEAPPSGLLSSGGPGIYKPEGEIWRRIQER